jgi:hypothetical protein
MARIEALESRLGQLQQQLGRIEERIALLVIGASPILGTSATPQAAVPTTARPSAARPDSAGATSAPATGPQLGPRGGCYVITSGGKKRYVSRERCG